MALFAKYAITVEDAERELKRPLGGDPSRGEHAVLVALNGTRLDDARRLMERDSSIRPDFRELIEERMRVAQLEPGDVKSWTVPLPASLWDEYAQLARRSNVSIGQCLAAAVQRDSDQRRRAQDVLTGLEATVQKYHRAASQLADDLQALVQRLGPLQELSVRIARIEKAVTSGARQ